MAGRSSSSAVKAFGLLRRPGIGQIAGALRLRGGAGLPVGTAPSPTAPLDESEELIWDDGSPFPEPCVDTVAPMVGKYEGLAMLSAGLGFLGFVGLLAAWNDKASRIPWTPREYPYNNLHLELGKDPES